MRCFLTLAAALVVVTSGLWVVVSARLNQRQPSGGTVELTERELRLVSLQGESTVTALALQWDVASDDPRRSRSPDWLSLAKLTELGFDCRKAATDPDARDHYASMPSAAAYLVLEYEGPAWKEARPDRRQTTRLFVVDAGKDARRLRERYPDLRRYFITRGVVGLFLDERKLQDGANRIEPRLRGSIQAVVPDRIFVPLPSSQILRSLGRSGGPGATGQQKAPRYAARVSWGARHEPWLQEVRLLP